MKEHAIAVVSSEPESIVALFERLAKDPAASVEKIERLMALWERGQAARAEQAFNTAMSETQAALRTVARDSTNPHTMSRYASYKALDDAARSHYTANGFALSFNTRDSPSVDVVRIVCKVTHLAGHAESYFLDMPADGKGSRGGDVMTKTHATASALSYGMRYLLRMVFNIAIGEADDDGVAAAGPPERPQERQAPPAKGQPAKVEKVISDAQRKRLFVVLRKSAHEEESVRLWLGSRFGIDSTKAILQRDYDFIITCLESSRPLPPYAWSKPNPRS